MKGSAARSCCMRCTAEHTVASRKFAVCRSATAMFRGRKQSSQVNVHTRLKKRAGLSKLARATQPRIANTACISPAPSNLR
jgi:hypothetical protein